MKPLLKKQTSSAFGKKIFLLGQANKTNYWLEEPRWACSWYWGFGYVETYTNNRNPSKAKDIQSHQHFKNTFFGHQPDGHFIHNPYDSFLDKTTFTAKEGWYLGELFAQFYLLRETAEFWHRGIKGQPGCNYTTIEPPIHEGYACQVQWRQINEKLIPSITQRILEILSPKEEA